MAYLFDTDAISELLRPRPAKRYLEWLSAVPSGCAVAVSLFAGYIRPQERLRNRP